jgi:hypothetical protein
LFGWGLLGLALEQMQLLLVEVRLLLVVVGTGLRPMPEVEQPFFFLVGIEFQQSWDVNL